MEPFLPPQTSQTPCLPPCKEVLLEIQINSIINKCLFAYSGTADDDRSFQHQSDSSPSAECTHFRDPHRNPPASVCDSVDILLQASCDAGAHLHGIVPPCLPSSYKGDERQVKGTCLSRTDTFPCSSGANGTPDIKHSGRKPPRPPTSPKLTSCASDTSLVDTRRTKADRRRKAAFVRGPTDASASIWALFFSLCFAVAILAQGFRVGSCKDKGAMSGSAASSAVGVVMRGTASAAGLSSTTGLRKGARKTLHRMKQGSQEEADHPEP